MKTKTIPIIITLSAASISCLFSLIGHADMRIFVLRLLVSVLLFYVIGCFVKFFVDKIFDKQKDEDEEQAASNDEDLSAADATDEEKSDADET